jgi:hypothetical protein
VDLHLDESRPLAVTNAYASGDDSILVHLAVDGRYVEGHHLAVDGQRVQVRIAAGDQVQTVDAETFLVSARVGDFVDTNYGLYYRMSR